MKTLAALLAASGLVYVGFAPTSTTRPPADPLPTRPLFPPFDPATVRPEPELEQIQFVPSAAFVWGRPVNVRIPPDYGYLTPGTYQLTQRPDGIWGDRGIFVTSFPGWPPQLCLHYDEVGSTYIDTRGYAMRAAFCDMHAVASDGSWRPHNTRSPPLDNPTLTAWFPNATQPWFVWQP